MKSEENHMEVGGTHIVNHIVCGDGFCVNGAHPDGVDHHHCRSPQDPTIKVSSYVGYKLQMRRGVEK